MRRLLLLFLLAGSAGAARAESIDWSFTYTGFHVTWTTRHNIFGTTTREEDMPAAEITGIFRGADLDGDGILEAGELSSFVVGAIDYTGCGVNPTRAMMCDLGHFSYVPGTRELFFSSGWHGNDEFFSGWGGWVTSGREAVDYTYNDYSESTVTMAWTDATRLSFRQLAPVPEPATGAMAAAGLALLGWRRRRH